MNSITVKVRHVLFGELAVLAARVNEAAYNLAVSANQAQGRLIRCRDAR